MTRNQMLIEQYKRRIKEIEDEIFETTSSARIMYLEGKICTYKLVIIDLQESDRD